MRAGSRGPAVGLALAAFALLGCERQELAPEPEPDASWLVRANRHDRDGWIYLHVEGPARMRGYQHGFLLAQEIAEGLAATRLEWKYRTAMEWEWLTQKAAAMMGMKVDRENLAELGGIVEGLAAAGVHTSRAEILTYNAIIELAGYWWPSIADEVKQGLKPRPRQSCSAFIATGSATGGRGVILGHNTMSDYWGLQFNLILDLVPEQGHRILMQGTPGWIHSGTDFFITDAGLVGAETTLVGFEGFDPKGTPEFARMRRATQDARSIADWVAIMRRGNNGGYANAWLIGDVNTGEIARLELGLKNVGFETKSDGWFVGSNFPEDLAIRRLESDYTDTDIRRSSVARRVRWQQLTAQNAGRIDLEAAKRFEADHYDTYLGAERPGERSLCGHFELEASPALPDSLPFEPTGTVDAKVVDAALARKMSFAARWGAACGMPFDAEAFLRAHPQYEWMSSILKSRPTQAWTTFTAGEH